jgi:hypothetical protein
VLIIVEAQKLKAPLLKLLRQLNYKSRDQNCCKWRCLPNDGA